MKPTRLQNLTFAYCDLLRFSYFRLRRFTVPSALFQVALFLACRGDALELRVMRH